MKESQKIIEEMIDGLEKPENNILTSDYVCHRDIPDVEDSFTVCGEDPDVTYLVTVHKIDL